MDVTQWPAGRTCSAYSRALCAAGLSVAAAVRPARSAHRGSQADSTCDRAALAEAASAVAWWEEEQRDYS